MKDITSFLIMPIQRIPRYELLFRELLKSSDPTKSNGGGSGGAAAVSSSSSSSLDELSDLVDRITRLARTVNEHKRAAEHASLLLSIQNRLHGDLPQSLLSPARRFVRKEEMRWVEDEQERLVLMLLFNDAVVYADERYQFLGWISLVDVRVRHVTMPPLNRHVLQFWHYEKEQLLVSFECGSNEVASKWESDIGTSQSRLFGQSSHHRRGSASSSTVNSTSLIRVGDTVLLDYTTHLQTPPQQPIKSMQQDDREASNSMPPPVHV